MCFDKADQFIISDLCPCIPMACQLPTFSNGAWHYHQCRPWWAWKSMQYDHDSHCFAIQSLTFFTNPLNDKLKDRKSILEIMAGLESSARYFLCMWPAYLCKLIWHSLQRLGYCTWRQSYQTAMSVIIFSPFFFIKCRLPCLWVLFPQIIHK